MTIAETGHAGTAAATAVATALLALLGLAAAALAEPPRLAAAGDIACAPGDPAFNGGAGTASACRMKATSDLVLALAPDAVLLLGDVQYELGELANFQASYDPSWGRFKAITRPAPGNHDYGTPGAAGYYAYFGAAAGDPAEGWYSFDLGDWHVVVLNSNCGAIGGCGAGSPQAQWLTADLAASPAACTLAAWHHPRFSSGPHGNDATFAAFWEILDTAGADLVLNGHEHVYERFAPQTPAGAADPAGIRQITAGTGGRNLTGFPLVRANSQVRRNDAFGVVELTLHPNGYEWRFVRTEGAVLDSGVGLCDGAVSPAPAGFHTVPPCRLLDTRAAGKGPALAAGETRAVDVAGACGVPADATAVAGNLTVVQPTADGHLRLFPWGAPLSGTSAINFRTGQARANNAVVPLGVGGRMAVRGDLAAPAATVHFVFDVAGYFR